MDKLIFLYFFRVKKYVKILVLKNAVPLNLGKNISKS